MRRRFGTSTAGTGESADKREGDGERQDRRWSVVFGAAVLVEVLVLTVLPRIVTVDGPAHVDGAWVLLHHGDPDLQLLRSLYRIDLTPVPNLLATLLLAGLLTLFGPDGAERILVVVLAASLPLALRYALRGLHPRAGWLAVVAVPFAASYLYYYGFYDFCLGLSLSLLVAGLALRHRRGWTPASCLALAGLLLLTWSAHLLPLVVACLLVAALAITRTVHDTRSGRPLRVAAARHLLAPVVAGLPVAALTAGFALDAGGARGAVVHKPWWDLLLGLATLGRPLVVYSPWEYAAASVVAATLVVLGVLARRDAAGRADADRTAVALTGLLVTLWYFLSPDRYGPAFGFLNDRLALYPPLLLALWCAGPPPRRAGRTAVAALLGAAVVLAGLRAPTEVRYQRDVAELLSVAPAVPRGSTLAALRYWRDAPAGREVRNPYRDPLRHESSRLAVLVAGVDVGHYEAVTTYFPARFRAAGNPRRALDPTLRGLDRVPPSVELAGGPDVVLVVGRNRAATSVLDDPESTRVLADLARLYRPVATSGRTGLVEVWRRR